MRKIIVPNSSSGSGSGGGGGTGSFTATAHQLAIASITPQWHIPFDGRLVGGLPINLTANTYPTGSVFSWNDQDWIVKEANCVDGLGTGFRRMFNVAAGVGNAFFFIPNATELTDFSWGVTISISPTQIDWADGSDWGFNPNDIQDVMYTHGANLSFNRNARSLYGWADGYVTWERGVGESFTHPNGFRLVQNVRKNATTTVWLNGSRAAQWTLDWSRAGSGVRNGGIYVGAVFTGNLGRHYAIRDYWFRPSVITQNQARLLSA
jgi:hypothetical protein